MQTGTIINFRLLITILLILNYTNALSDNIGSWKFYGDDSANTEAIDVNPQHRQHGVQLRLTCYSGRLSFEIIIQDARNMSLSEQASVNFETENLNKTVTGFKIESGAGITKYLELETKEGDFKFGEIQEIISEMVAGSYLTTTLASSDRDFFAKFSLNGMTRSTYELRNDCGLKSNSEKKTEINLAQNKAKKGSSWAESNGDYKEEISEMSGDKKTESSSLFSLLNLDKKAKIRILSDKNNNCKTSAYIGLFMTKEPPKEIILNVNGTKVRYSVALKNGQGIFYYQATSPKGKAYVFNHLRSDGTIIVKVRDKDGSDDVIKFYNAGYTKAEQYFSNKCKNQLEYNKDAL